MNHLNFIMARRSRAAILVTAIFLFVGLSVGCASVEGVGALGADRRAAAEALREADMASEDAVLALLPKVHAADPVPAGTATNPDPATASSPAPELSATSTANPVNSAPQSVASNASLIYRYPYLEDREYLVRTELNHITDIILEAGEHLVSPPAAGDTSRWALELATSGAGDRSREHIYIKPLTLDAETNLILSTDRRVYRLRLQNTKDQAMAAVAWLYPRAMPKPRFMNKEVARLSKLRPEQINWNYTIRGSRRITWRPERVFNDGEKTYIIFPQNLASLDAPSLYILNSITGEAEVCNYRVLGRVYMVDKVIERAELRSGAKGNHRIRIEQKN